MKISRASLFLFGFVLASPVFAEGSSIKVNDINTADDTTITIKKGPVTTTPDTNAKYEILSGSDEITGDEEWDEKKALADWKQACNDWKKELKELNKDNSILSLNCGARTKDVEKSKTTYHSTATYKIRVKVKEGAN